MGCSSWRLLWLGWVGAILCSSWVSQAPFPPFLPLQLPAASPQEANVNAPPSGLAPASPLITPRPWVFSSYRASGQQPTQTPCNKADPGSSNHPWRARRPRPRRLPPRPAGEPLYIPGAQQGEGASERPGLAEGTAPPARRGAESRSAASGSQGGGGATASRGGGAGSGRSGPRGLPPPAVGSAYGPRAPGRAAGPGLRARELQPLLAAAGGGGAGGWTSRAQAGGSGAAAAAGVGALSRRAARPLPGEVAMSQRMTWVDGEDGISFIHPSSEPYLQPLAVLLFIVIESHGEVEIQLHLSYSHCLFHCLLKDCQRQAELGLVKCLCPEGMELAADNITCVALPTQPGLLVLLVTVIVTSTLSLLMVCGVLILGKEHPAGMADSRLPTSSLSYIFKPPPRQFSAPTTASWGLAWPSTWPLPPRLTEVSPANVTLFRALGHGGFGEVYEGLVTGFPWDPSPLLVTVKTLPELCSQQNELDFLMEALIIIQPSPLAIWDLFQLAQDIAQSCHYLEENHFIQRSFGVLLWEISLGYMPYPGWTNQDMLYFIVGGKRMGPPRGCPGLCWQHQLELCPSFAGILEHLQNCIQVPAHGSGPTLEQEGTSGLRSRSLEGLRSRQAQELNLESLKSWGRSLLCTGLKTLKSKFQPQGKFQRNLPYGS
ncbi:unnamed protein product [Nyctereutes procyonoides]|uniref:(raccoon dog) hypothetical protein n=1 Tax=Nyctereutes procyonoides TaxID=34880 RepID=A0A811Y1I9_NYCPR|nr:unnamed protein product [Nyctereutes procyonoides]